MATAQVNVADALRFPMAAVLRRYEKDHAISHAAALRVERELKRFLIVCASHPGARFSPSRAVDDLWHTFLLFTKDYAAFCDTLGAGFLHHQPFDVSSRSRRVKRTTPPMTAHYRKLFDEVPPLDLWPDSSADCNAPAPPPDCDAALTNPKDLADCNVADERGKPMNRTSS